MTCPRCGLDCCTIHTITEVTSKTKHRGCFGWMLWILLALCTCGLILIIPLLTNRREKIKTKTHTEAVCQSCGYRWKL